MCLQAKYFTLSITQVLVLLTEFSIHPIYQFRHHSQFSIVSFA